MIRFKVDKPQFTDFGNVMKCNSITFAFSYQITKKINDCSSYDKFVFLY